MLRLAGVTGADPDGIPWVNRLVDAVARATSGWGTAWRCRCSHALAREGVDDVTLLAQKAAAGSVRFERADRAGGDGGPARPRAGGRRRASGASTGAGPSGTGWSSGTATRSSGRGST